MASICESPSLPKLWNDFLTTRFQGPSGVWRTQRVTWGWQRFIVAPLFNIFITSVNIERSNGESVLTRSSVQSPRIVRTTVKSKTGTTTYVAPATEFCGRSGSPTSSSL